MQMAGLGSSTIRLYEVSCRSFTRSEVLMWVAPQAAQSVRAVVVEISVVSISNPASRPLKLFAM